MIYNFISENPFRILGVYSNSSLKDITANKTRIAAYAKVNKSIDFPIDLTCLSTPVNRTSESVSEAEKRLAMPVQKIKYALFWFTKKTAIDEMALTYLQSEDLEKAHEIFSKKVTDSSLVNRSTLALINDNVEESITCILSLLHAPELLQSFTSTICDDSFQIETIELWKMYADVLIQNYDATKVYNILTASGIATSEETQYIREKAVAGPISEIYSQISKARDADSDDPDESYRAGKVLMQKTKTTLATIKKILGTNDSQYQIVADALAQQILQCGINYYNETDDDDDIDKALVLQKYAYTIAATKLVKDRCKKNVEILNKKKETEGVNADIEFVAKSLAEFRDKMLPSIYSAKNLVNSCKPHLTQIANALGSSHELYIKISTAVANHALGMLIDVINQQQSNTTNILNGTLESSISEGLALIDLIRTLDMTTEERDRVTKNRSTLSSMKTQLQAASISHRTTPTYTPSSRNSSSSDKSGCLIWLIIWVVLSLIVGAIIDSTGGDFSVGFIVTGILMLMIYGAVNN